MSDSVITNQKIAVIGAGYIGSVLGAVLADRGASVIAIDVNEEVISFLNSGRAPVREPGLDDLIARVVDLGRFSASSDISDVAGAGVILITVGTPLDEQFQANTQGIDDVVSKLSPHVVDGQLIIVKSTVPPFTTERHVYEPLKKHADVRVAFCPERLAEGNAIEECRKIPVVVGGTDADSGAAAEKFWREYLGVDVIRVDSARAAELVKLADNAWIDLNIAMSFELAKVADAISIDVLPVIDAANSLPKGRHNVNILTPSIGVGGYCLTKDPWFLDAFAKRAGFDFKTAVTSRTVNDGAPGYAANKINEWLMSNIPTKRASEIKIAVLGLAFKNNTGDCRFTPTLPFVDHLKSYSYDISIFDPWLDEGSWNMFHQYRREDSIEAAIQSADCVVFAAGHDAFRYLTGARLKTLSSNLQVVFDGRMFFTEPQVVEFRSNGIEVMGVGR